MSNCTDIIHQHVIEHIRSGTAVDVYKMAIALEKNCPGMSIKGIAQHITAAVAVHHGNAIWDPPGKFEPSAKGPGSS